MSQPSWYAKVDALLTEGMTAEEAVDAVLAEASDEEIRSHVRGLLLKMARDRGRRRVRSVESVVIADVRQNNGNANSRTFRALLAERVTVPPSGVAKTWGELTISDHAARAKFLRAQAHRVNTTAALHEKAIEVLRASGAPTLGDLLAQKAQAA